MRVSPGMHNAFSTALWIGCVAATFLIVLRVFA